MRHLLEYLIGVVVSRKRSSMLDYGNFEEAGLLLVLDEQVVLGQEVA